MSALGNIVALDTISIAPKTKLCVLLGSSAYLKRSARNERKTITIKHNIMRKLIAAINMTLD